MAVLVNFYSRHDSGGESEFFALAREVITDEVFVIHSISKPAESNCPFVESKIDLVEFLTQNGPGCSDLVGLIGTLVVEK